MKHFLFLLLLITSIPVLAFTPKLMTKKIKGFNIEISKNCKNNCMAFNAVRKLSKEHIRKIKDDVYGGKSIGNIICRKVFRAEIKYYKDINKNEQHFCIFKDKTYLSVSVFDYLETELVTNQKLPKKFLRHIFIIKKD